VEAVAGFIAHPLTEEQVNVLSVPKDHDLAYDSLQDPFLIGVRPPEPTPLPPAPPAPGGLKRDYYPTGKIAIGA
jgi:hypothetical protein